MWLLQYISIRYIKQKDFSLSSLHYSPSAYILIIYFLSPADPLQLPHRPPPADESQELPIFRLFHGICMAHYITFIFFSLFGIFYCVFHLPNAVPFTTHY